MGIMLILFTLRESRIDISIPYHHNNNNEERLMREKIDKFNGLDNTLNWVRTEEEGDDFS